MKSAVLLIVYNRPEKTKKVYEQIRKAKPSRFYVTADGPLPGQVEDRKRCMQAREIVKEPDWDCRFKFVFRDENLGCGPSVKEAIDWFFEHEEEGIILEDDTVPDPTFFQFCEEMLDRYRGDRRIAFVSGSNHYGVSNGHDKSSGYGRYNGDVSSNGHGRSNGQAVAITKDSYFFARNKTTWGWATWRRSWDQMDYEMNWLASPNADQIIRNMSLLKETSKYWMNAVMSIKERNVSAWDWQWYFSVAAEDQLVIYPQVNLVSNIGFGADATHTTGRPEMRVSTRFSMKFPLNHPADVVASDDWDRTFEEQKLQIRFWIVKKYMPIRLKRFIRRKLREIRAQQ